MTKYVAIKCPQTRETLKKYSKKYKLYIHESTIDWWLKYGVHTGNYLVLQLSKSGRQACGGYCRNDIGDMPVLTLEDGVSML